MASSAIRPADPATLLCGPFVIPTFHSSLGSCHVRVLAFSFMAEQLELDPVHVESWSPSRIGHATTSVGLALLLSLV
jgi:hypothetical protein